MRNQPKSKHMSVFLLLLVFVAWVFMMPSTVHAMELDGDEITEEIVENPDELILNETSGDASEPEILSEDGDRLTPDGGSGEPYSGPTAPYSDIPHGYCGVSTVNNGENVDWVLEDTNGDETYDTLTISKNPVETETSDDNFDMMDFSNNSSDANYYQKAPWYPYKDEITTVIIEDGVTSVGAYSFFYDYSAIKTVTIGNSVTTIKPSAFWKCIGITEITIPASVTRIYQGAFGLCSLRTINFEKEDNIVYVEGSAFDTQ